MLGMEIKHWNETNKKVKAAQIKGHQDLTRKNSKPGKNH